MYSKCLGADLNEMSVSVKKFLNVSCLSRLKVKMFRSHFFVTKKSETASYTNK